MEGVNKQMSLLYGYNDGGSVKFKKPIIKTFETDITISEYGSPKTVKEFNSGIVLLGIVTRGGRSISSKDIKVNYDFYDVTGNKHISTIHGSEYKLIKDITHITNIPSCHTCLDPSSISINLMGETIKETKPSKPIKLTILIQYIELSNK